MRYAVVVDPARHSEFIRQIAESARVGLANRGHEVHVLDLAAEQFSPVMSPADRRAYFTPDPLTSPETIASADVVRHAGGLVFVYPTTLSTLSPGLKGWIDRTFVPGVAFTIGDPNASRRGLSGITQIVGISMYDEQRSAVRRLGDNGRRIIRRNIRLCAGVRTRTKWIAMYGVADSSELDRAEFLHRVERALG